MVKFHKSVFPLIFLVSITILFGFAQDASAAVQTLIDENAVVMIEDGAGGSNAGVVSYTVDGVDHMVQEALWVSLPGSAEVPVASLGVISVTTTDTGTDGDDDQLSIIYDSTSAPNGYQISQRFTLTGGAPGSGTATLDEILFMGRPGTFVPEPIEVFHYTNYDAEGLTMNTAIKPISRTVEQGLALSPPSTITDFEPTPQFRVIPDAIELNTAANLLGRLNDGAPDVIVDTPIATTFGPADAAFVAHYDCSVAGNFAVCQMDIKKTIQAQAQPPMPVGGEMIPVESTSLILAGSQMTAAWMIPVIVSAIGIAIVIARKF